MRSKLGSPGLGLTGCCDLRGPWRGGVYERRQAQAPSEGYISPNLGSATQRKRPGVGRQFESLGGSRQLK